MLVACICYQLLSNICEAGLGHYVRLVAVKYLFFDKILETRTLLKKSTKDEKIF